MFLTLCWAVWSARCTAAMENEIQPPASVWAYAMKVCKEVQEAGEKQVGQCGAGVSHPVRWHAPTAGWVKINVDAGQVGDRGAGLGVVCRDHEGSVLGCVAVQTQAGWEARIAEAQTVLEGVRFAVQWRHSHVIIESDCLQLIQAIQNPVLGVSDFHLVVEDILALSSRLLDVVWSFVKRSGNKVAHVLAHLQGNRTPLLGG